MYEGSLYSTSLTCVLSWLVRFSHSDRCEAISHYSFENGHLGGGREMKWDGFWVEEVGWYLGLCLLWASKKERKNGHLLVPAEVLDSILGTPDNDRFINIAKSTSNDC